MQHGIAAELALAVQPGLSAVKTLLLSRIDDALRELARTTPTTSTTERPRLQVIEGNNLQRM
jgi:hypothetical protein